MTKGKNSGWENGRKKTKKGNCQVKKRYGKKKRFSGGGGGKTTRKKGKVVYGRRKSGRKDGKIKVKAEKKGGWI